MIKKGIIMYKFELYKKFKQNFLKILEEGKKEADKIGIPKKERGTFGLGGGSGTPPTLSKDVLKPIQFKKVKLL